MTAAAPAQDPGGEDTDTAPTTAPTTAPPSQGSQPVPEREAPAPEVEGPVASEAESEEVAPDAGVEYVRIFSVDLTIHVEDMYNFNPGQSDLVSGTPDSDNGRFELTGLGHEFLQTATVLRHLDFQSSMAAQGEAPDGSGVSGSPRASGPPRDSRRRATAR